MKLKLCLPGLLCLFFQTYAQSPDHPQALQTGDPMPDMHISGILNYREGGKPASAIRLSQFSDKLLILDFWGTYCTPCLHLLPKYDSLQQAFRGKVQFLAVTREKSKTVQAFYKKTATAIPSVTGDIFLSRLFPHNSIPFEVWIRNGTIIAMTYGDDVNAQTISQALSGTTRGIDQRKDDFSLDPLQPLLANGNGKGQVRYQSVITAYLPGVNAAAGFQKTPEKIVAVALNHSPLALYQQAWMRTDPLYDLANRCSVELPDSLKNVVDQGGGPGFHEWIKQYGYCYQLTLPPGFTGDLTAVIASDLNRYFGTRYGIGARLEKQDRDCLVLSRIPGTPSIGSQGGQPLFRESDQAFTLHNLPVQSLSMDIAQRYRRLTTPFLDETGYHTPVDIQINCRLSNLPSLQKELRRSGLDLSVKKRSIDILVIRQIPRTLPPTTQPTPTTNPN